jgi:transcription factor CP2-like protein
VKRHACLTTLSSFSFQLKGAERKTRDEERRAAKRKLTATGRKKLDELYHTSCERTEFYAMSDTAKPPVLFSPAEDLDKVNVSVTDFYHPLYYY